jgi:HK97 family phage prohead protease
MPPAPEWKILPLTDAKVTADGTGSLAGYASTFGNVDSYGDTIAPGAYTKHLSRFVDHGFIAWSHDWETMIGTVASAKQDHTGLYITADFHSTPEAQTARTIAAERIARGKSMGLSIGYLAHQWADRDGKDGITRELQEIEVFETSLVAIPADSYAQVTGVKSHPFTERPTKLWTVPGFKIAPPPEPEPEPEPVLEDEDDLETPTERFADQFERVLLESTAVAERARDIAELRQKSGRVLSEANRRRLAALREQINELSGQLEDLLTATEPAPSEDPEKAQLAAEIEAMFARHQAIDALHRDLSRHSAELEGARP